MSIKIDIISGFLGAGKTTLIKKLISEKLKNDKIAIIENEFGEVSIDGDLLKGKNVDIKEINSGCICCSIVGDFKDSIREIIKSYKPNRILIEPSGVAKLSDVIKSCKDLGNEYSFNINYIFTVVDVSNFDMYLENFGEFYKDQLIKAKTIVLSRKDNITEQQVDNVTAQIRNINKTASIIAAPLDSLDSNDIFKIANGDLVSAKEKSLKKAGTSLVSRSISRHNHRADNVFDTWGIETTKLFTIDNLKGIFEKIKMNDDYGNILRGKGLVKSENGEWLEFHYTPGQFQVKKVNSQHQGKIAIIGEKIDKSKLKYLFK